MDKLEGNIYGIEQDKLIQASKLKIDKIKYA